MYIREHRQPEHEVNDIFVNRWSPRAMSGEPLSKEELMPLFEAARWAPSCRNEQPWLFLYALRDTPQWPLFFDLLVEFNQLWCKNAAALVVILSRKTFEANGNPNPAHSFDTGAAWQNVCLQGSLRGLVVHGMAGFDYEKARDVLKVPDNYAVNAMMAIGKPGNIENLPEKLQAMEIPSTRKPTHEILKEGAFE